MSRLELVYDALIGYSEETAYRERTITYPTRRGIIQTCPLPTE